MQITQRSILVLMVVLALCFATILKAKTKEENVLKDWERIRAERFLGCICRGGSVTYDEYCVLFDALSGSKQRTEIRIEEYKREQDLEKNIYYSLTSWDEVKEMLFTEGEYVFSKESLIVIEVRQTGRYRQRKCRYSGWFIKE